MPLEEDSCSPGSLLSTSGLRHFAAEDGCPLGLLSLREAEGAGGKTASGAGGTGAGR